MHFQPLFGRHQYGQELRLALHGGIEVLWHLELRDVLQEEDRPVTTTEGRIGARVSEDVIDV